MEASRPAKRREQKSGKAVNLGKLTKRLRRDITANPMKAGLLGLMVLVACYFWAPLIRGAVGFKQSTAAAVSPVILTDDPVDASQPASKTNKAFRWERMLSAIAGDALMASAKHDRGWRDPFASFVPKVAAVETEPPMPLAVPVLPDPPIESTLSQVVITPAEAGLVLQAALVGPRFRAATINGEVYHEGELVPASADAANAPFRVVKVLGHAVQLEANGKKQWLEFVKTKLAQGDELTLRPFNAP